MSSPSSVPVRASASSDSLASPRFKQAYMPLGSRPAGLRPDMDSYAQDQELLFDEIRLPAPLRQLNSYVAPREYPRQRRLIYLTVTASAWALITSLGSLSVSANHTLLPMVRRESENPPLTVTQSTQALQDFLASSMASPGLLA
ncbi:hypothetical protein KC367_g8654 [Hortaea werneckii]|nr:hypothetical protein KC367_g8654 [Hortaea werneckii]